MQGVSDRIEPESDQVDCNGENPNPQVQIRHLGHPALRRLEESAVVLAFRQKMASETAKTQYRRRSQVAEFPNAWIKSKLGLRQFHVRGLVKVQMEILWTCLTYDLQQWMRFRKLQVVPVTR